MAVVNRADVYSKGGHILNAGDIVAVKMVTVVGQAGDFAVYQGTSAMTDEEVAFYGDKVSENAGRAVAPYCAHLHYRQ